MPEQLFDERVSKLEVTCKFFQKELDEFKHKNSAEISQLTKSLKTIEKDIENLNIVLIKIKWLLTGALFVYFAQEVGLIHLLKSALAAL